MEDDVPQLSTEALQALLEFYEEEALREKQLCDIYRTEQVEISENWQLSQFWYDEDTSQTLAYNIFKQCCDNSEVALISCPSLYKPLRAFLDQSNMSTNVFVLEYDKRFQVFGDSYVFYDYNSPVDLRGDFKGRFDIIIADPPFLSEECLTKVSETVNYLKRENHSVILCTGAILDDLANVLLNVKRCQFAPKHKNNLANEFICLTNFGDLVPIS